MSPAMHSKTAHGSRLTCYVSPGKISLMTDLKVQCIIQDITVSIVNKPLKEIPHLSLT